MILQALDQPDGERRSLGLHWELDARTHDVPVWQDSEGFVVVVQAGEEAALLQVQPGAQASRVGRRANPIQSERSRLSGTWGNGRPAPRLGSGVMTVKGSAGMRETEGVVRRLQIPDDVQPLGLQTPIWRSL